MSTDAKITAGILSGVESRQALPDAPTADTTADATASRQSSALKCTTGIPDRDTQSRKWQLTINNPKEKGYTHDKINEIIQQNFKSVIYYCLADEVGENGTYHTHIFLCGRSGIRFSTLRRRFEGAHFEMCNGTAQENMEYVSKTGKWKNHEKSETRVQGSFEEYGEMPIERKGRKNNMDDVYSMIKDGYSNFQIMEQMPEVMLYMDKIEVARQSILGEKYNTQRRSVDVVYIYGDTGTGKTRSIIETYGYSDVFRVTNYLHPFDGYRGQDVIVFEEFRTSINISEMLNYTDIHPVMLPCRYADKPACYTKVYITSNISLPEQYKNETARDIDAFYRRISKIRHFTYEGIQEYKIERIGSGFRIVLDGEFVPFLPGGVYRYKK